MYTAGEITHEQNQICIIIIELAVIVLRVRALTIIMRGNTRIYLYNNSSSLIYVAEVYIGPF